MASPAKAYIDPTFVSKVGPLMPPEFTSGMATTEFNLRTTKAWLPSEKFTDANHQVMMRPTTTPDQVLVNHQPRIPTPPMGRMLVLTFPPVYKERTANRPQTGQIWPRKVKVQ